MDRARTRIGNYEYEVRTEFCAGEDAPARRAFKVYKVNPAEELVTVGASSPSLEHAARNARQLTALYIERDRIQASESGEP